MTKSLIKLIYNPNYKIKLQTQISKDNTFSDLPVKFQGLKQKFLSENGFNKYKQLIL